MKPSFSHEHSNAPQWAKDLLAEVRSLQREDVIEKMKSKLPSLVGADVPEKFYASRSLPESEEGLQAFAEAVKSDYASFKQDMIKQGLMTDSAPAGGEKAGVNTGDADADIKMWAANSSSAGAAEGDSAQKESPNILDSDIDKWASRK